MTEQNAKIKSKVEDKTLLLLCDLQPVIGRLDNETMKRIQGMIYTAFSCLADEIRNIEGHR
jgi:hypothetical protein